MSPLCEVVEALSEFPKLSHPAVLTIGNFDGVHVGHQAVLQRAHQLALEQHTVLAAITFKNHPSEVVKPNQKVIPLCTLPHKIHLLRNYHVDVIATLPFTHELSQQSAETFLNHVKHYIPFSHLVLGHDACIGKGRQGDRLQVERLAAAWGFGVHYLEPLTKGDVVVSSSRIRERLATGKLDEVETLLGRRPSFFGLAQPGNGLGKTIGYPTLNLDITGLCVPPFGVYAVEITTHSSRYRGIANLGLAPTVRTDGRILLEAFLFDYHEKAGDKEIEVFLHQFIRPERKFSDLNALKTQIAEDIAASSR